MIIKTVTFEGRVFMMTTPEELVEAGVPEAVIQSVISAERTAVIKKECRRRIYAIASAETQMNMATATATISAKSAASRTPSENAIVEGVAAALVWVSAMRAAISPLVNDATANIDDDNSWPACPPNVLAIVGQF